METSYYKEYYTLERENWYFKARNDIIMDHIRSTIPTEQPNLKILNVGAGTGFTSVLLSEIGNVQSLEFNPECCEFIKNELHLDIIEGSILDLPYENNSFDLVCAFDVVEHVEDDQKAILELKRVCKKGGFVTITVPAFMSLWSSHDTMNHHFRRYRIKPLLELFNSSHEKFLCKSYYNFFLFLPLFLFRKVKGWTTKDKAKLTSKTDYSFIGNSGIIPSILYSIFVVEKYLLRLKMKLPFGVSIIATWSK